MLGVDLVPRGRAHPVLIRTGQCAEEVAFSEKSRDLAAPDRARRAADSHLFFRVFEWFLRRSCNRVARGMIVAFGSGEIRAKSCPVQLRARVAEVFCAIGAREQLRHVRTSRPGVDLIWVSSHTRPIFCFRQSPGPVNIHILTPA